MPGKEGLQMKRIPIEQKKISITIALLPDVLAKLDRLADEMKCSRSAILAEAIRGYLEDQQEFTDVPDFPDDVSEIGYNPYTGSYEEDL